MTLFEGLALGVGIWIALSIGVFALLLWKYRDRREIAEHQDEYYQ